MHAGFGRIDNRCPQPVTIVSAKSASYGDIELHESRTVDGVSRMRQLKELRIAPKEAATLKPGGMHLMLMDPTSPLKPGSHVLCAVTGEPIPLEELRYWSARLQEAYISPEVATKRLLGLA